MNQAVGYIRVSTERQADEGVSLEAQKGKIEAWCEANGYELAAVYVDAGISGKRMDTRPELQKALKAIKKGMALVVYSLSRLARSTKDAISINEAIAKKKGDLVSLAEKLDATTATGKMMFQMLAVLAEFERSLVGERTKAALAHKKSSGAVYTAVTPFGYQAIEGRLVKVEQEAELVAEMRRQRTSGATLAGIAQSLNDRGIQGKSGGRWYASTVSNILNRAA